MLASINAEKDDKMKKENKVISKASTEIVEEKVIKIAGYIPAGKEGYTYIQTDQRLIKMVHKP